jgi:preprotein translocase subunit SecE
VARNRKRAKERRARRPQGAAVRPGLATAGDENGAPDPIEHAAPDVDLANAQLAIGRGQPLDPGEDPEDEAEFEAEAETDAEEFEEAEADRGGGPPRGRALAVATGSVAEPAARPRSRLVGFLQGSWRELQRVQWPDRRQVVQATGVVLGFVIIAGLYLALADTLATKLMNFILK